MSDKTHIVTTEEDKNPIKQKPADGTIVKTAAGSSQIEVNRNKKKLGGMLVSFSKDGYGECWPLFVGANRIGSGLENDARLMEKSVSAKHALLSIRRISDESMVFELRDEGSSTGTRVNGKDHSEFNNYIKLKESDRIQIGNYNMLFIPLDNIDLSLLISPDFQSKSDEIQDYTI